MLHAWTQPVDRFEDVSPDGPPPPVKCAPSKRYMGGVQPLFCGFFDVVTGFAHRPHRFVPFGMCFAKYLRSKDGPWAGRMSGAGLEEIYGYQT